VALRLGLSPDLPLSQHLSCAAIQICQFWKLRSDVRFGSVAVIQTNPNRMAALGRIADIGQ
jgi:hypothetical protein